MQTVNLLMTFALFAPVALVVAGQVAGFRAAAFPVRRPAPATIVAATRREASAAAANDEALLQAA